MGLFTESLNIFSLEPEMFLYRKNKKGKISDECLDPTIIKVRVSYLENSNPTEILCLAASLGP